MGGYRFRATYDVDHGTFTGISGGFNVQLFPPPGEQSRLKLEVTVRANYPSKEVSVGLTLTLNTGLVPNSFLVPDPAIKTRLGVVVFRADDVDFFLLTPEKIENETGK